MSWIPPEQATASLPIAVCVVSHELLNQLGVLIGNVHVGPVPVRVDLESSLSLCWAPTTGGKIVPGLAAGRSR